MTLALILSNQKIKVTIVDKNSKKNLSKFKDKRTSAISQGSTRLLKNIGIWETIKKNAQPINKIKVSEGLNGFKINFNSHSLNEGPLGFIVDNQFLKKIFFEKINDSIYVDFIDDFEIKEIRQNENNASIYSNKGKFNAQLLVGADGRYSKMRYFANIKSFFHDYKQVAFVFSIIHDKPHNSSAIEIFFPSGPLALLPMLNKKRNESSVVWTVEAYKKNELLNSNNFKKEFIKNYANVFGNIKKISKPVIYNLNIFSCYEYFKKRTVLIGDACQAIHPIAGQGLNLGFRDALQLGKVLIESKNLGLDLGSHSILNDYTLKRLVDKNLLVQATHRLNKLFSNNSFLMRKFRDTGLRIFNKSDFLKRQSMLFAMGLRNFDF